MPRSICALREVGSFDLMPFVADGFDSELCSWVATFLGWRRARAAV
ncbi:MAG: hypothetical protein ACKVX7_07180 [Planctomycetota bacterium]